jgi:hypothetical protein
VWNLQRLWDFELSKKLNKKTAGNHLPAVFTYSLIQPTFSAMDSRFPKGQLSAAGLAT